MFTFVNQPGGRIVTISLRRGEMLLEGVQKAIEDNGIRDAVVLSCIGTLSAMTWHRVTTLDARPKEEYPTVRGPLELCAVQGLVVAGVPHFHIVCSDRNGTYAGHLEPGCEVLYLAEVVLMELAGAPLRRVTDENGLRQLAQEECIGRTEK